MMQYQVFEDVLFYMLFGGVAVAAIIACCFYMIISVKQYRKWLRDNYADLENKEVWQSIVVLVDFMFILSIYWFDDGNKTLVYLIQWTKIVLIALLLWRVETLQQLDSVTTKATDTPEAPTKPDIAPSTLPSSIGQLFERHCDNTQLYLQHDLTLSQLSQAIGTNHYYLSQHFAQQGLTSHFQNLQKKRFKICNFCGFCKNHRGMCKTFGSSFLKQLGCRKMVYFCTIVAITIVAITFKRMNI